MSREVTLQSPGPNGARDEGAVVTAYPAGEFDRWPEGAPAEGLTSLDEQTADSDGNVTLTLPDGSCYVVWALTEGELTVYEWAIVPHVIYSKAPVSGKPDFDSGVLTASDDAEAATPHGLGVVPSEVVIIPAGGFAPGAEETTPADADNVYVTCASDTGSKYQILAWK